MIKPAAIFIAMSLAPLALTQSVWTTGVDFQVGYEKITLNGNYNKWDVFNSVWAHRSGNTFDSTPAPIGNTGCTISYSGHGDTQWTTTNGISNTLLGAVAPAVMAEKHPVHRQCVDWSCGERPPCRCAKWQDVTDTDTIHTEILSRATIYVRNVPPQGSGEPSSDQGEMTYQISCPAAPAPDCSFCKGAKLDLQAGSLIPEVGVFFSAANVVLSAACLKEDC